jgi:outer membrane protein assembly factor BamB
MSRGRWLAPAAILMSFVVLLIGRPPVRGDAPRPEKVRVLLLGDSTVIGSICRQVAPKANHLEDVIRKLLAAEDGLPPVEVVNQGRDGEFIHALLSARYEREVAKLGPFDFVLIRYGINDRHFRQDFATNFRQDYRALIKRLRTDQPKAQIVLETIIPYMGEERDREVNDAVRAVAKAEGLPVLDTHARFAAELKHGLNMLTYRRLALDKVPARYRALLPDGTVVNKQVIVMDNTLDAHLRNVPGWFSDRHPNLAGYHVIGDEAARFLTPRIREHLKGRAGAAGSWAQFRGPGGRGLPDSDRPLPARLGPERNVLWKVALPPGHSSPIVHGEHIYLTAVRDRKLLTMALDRRTGKVLWEAESPYRQLEKIHAIGSHAQATPATDGTRVVSFFGSSGVFCHDADGKLLWHLPLGPFKNDFGAASSPLIVGDRVIVGQDSDQDSFLMAIDKHTGKVLWKADRSEFPVSFASPVLLEAQGQKQVVVAGTLRVVAYDLETGREAWTVRGMARVMNMTPSVGPDGTVYATGWTAGGDATERFDVPPFAMMLARHDADKNGTLELGEMPDGPLKERFSQIDRDKDGHVTAQEYEGMRRIFDAAHNRMAAIRPGGRGDVTATHVLWEHARDLPVIPSPLYFKGLLFLPKNGGFLTVLDARTGETTRRDRVPGVGNYYSSPVGGDGKVYLFSQRGDVVVLSAEPQWRVLSHDRFGEEVFATPAIVDGRIYVRTAGHLYCFGARP